MNLIVKLYVRSIRRKKRTLEDVPEELREQVKKYLEENEDN